MNSKQFTESTTSGSVATVATPVGKTQTRGKGIYPNEKGGNLLTGKKFPNSVVEVLNTRADGTWDNAPDWMGMDKFVFTASNGVQYQLDFLSPEIGPEELGPESFDITDNLDKAAWDKIFDSAKFISFEQVNDENEYEPGKQGIEGTGAAAEVFGSVVNAIFDYIKKTRPSMLYFQAVEPNRIRLYKSMINRLIKKLPGWNAEQAGPRGAHFAVYNEQLLKRLASKKVKPMKEAKLDEEDVIIVPGQGNRIKPGFIPRDKDRTDHEVEMALSDLFQSAKNAKHVYELIKDIPETVGIEGWVQEKIIKANDYLNTVREYLEHKQNDYRAMAEGEEQGTKMNKTCSRCGDSLFRFSNTIKCHKCNQTWKASPKNKENQGVAEGSDQNYQVGDQVLTQVGGRWLPAVITKPINAAGNYGVKFKVGSKVMNYVSSPDQLKKQGVAEDSENNFVQPNLEVWYEGRFAGWTTGNVYDDPYSKYGKMVAFKPNPREYQGDEGRILALPHSEISLRKPRSIGKLKGSGQGVAEASDISGLMTAASMVKDYIVTAEVDGVVKKFRIRGVTGPQAAKERFLKHASMAKVLKVEEQGVTEGFPYDVDHMPGKTTKHTSTNCTTCHGRKSMYKLGGKLFSDNKQGATKVKCPTCKGTGDKQGVAEGVYSDKLDAYIAKLEAKPKLTKREWMLLGTAKDYRSELARKAADGSDHRDAPSRKGVEEGYRILPPIDKERYGDRSYEGLEGPFRARNGKVYYYDPKAGMAYDPDTDIYIDYDELKMMDTEMSEGIVGKVLGGAALLAALWGIGQNQAQQVYSNSPQLQTLIKYHQMATQQGDQAKIEELERRIENHKTRLSLGKGEVMGDDDKPIVPRYESSIMKGIQNEQYGDKRDFKRREMEHELGHETNNYAVVIDGRQWKVFADKRQAENIARSLKNKGKNASVRPTSASVSESKIPDKCPECGGKLVAESELNEEGNKDACYHKVKSRYKVWPSAYASGALVKCRKVGASNWGNKKK